jgi:hypothetical protein
MVPLRGIGSRVGATGISILVFAFWTMLSKFLSQVSPVVMPARFSTATICLVHIINKTIVSAGGGEDTEDPIVTELSVTIVAVLLLWLLASVMHEKLVLSL